MKEDATAEGKEPENVSLNLDDAFATTTAANDIDNAEFQRSTEVVPTTTTTTNSIGDLAGIQQEYSPGEYNNLDEYVNAYNSTTDKTKLIILETHQVNNNDDKYNDTIPNQADNRPNDGESTIILLRNSEDLDLRNSEVSTNDTVLEQSNESHT